MEVGQVTTGCRQFLQLIWKNSQLRKRHYIVTVLEVLLPLTFCIVVVAIADIVDFGRKEKYLEKTLQDPLQFISFNPIEKSTRYSSWGRFYVAFTPNTSLTSDLMNRTMEKIGEPAKPMDVDVTAHDTEKDVELFLAKVEASRGYSPDSLGIVFTSMSEKDTLLPDKLQYKLRFTSTNLYTASKYPTSENDGPRRYDGYEKFFWQFQSAIDLSFIEMTQEMRKLTPRNIEVSLHRFPYPSYIESELFGFLDALSHVIVFGLVLLYPVIVKRIVDEKANRAKEMMKMMGMSDLVYWGSTFMINLIHTTVIMAIITMLFKVPLSFGIPILVNTDGVVFFVTLLLYSVASLLFCFLISTFFTSPVIAVIASVLLWTCHHVLMFGFIFLPVYGQKMLFLSVAQKMGICLLPNGALQMAIKVISTLENYDGSRMVATHAPAPSSPAIDPLTDAKATIATTPPAHLTRRMEYLFGRRRLGEQPVPGRGAAIHTVRPVASALYLQTPVRQLPRRSVQQRACRGGTLLGVCGGPSCSSGGRHCGGVRQPGDRG